MQGASTPENPVAVIAQAPPREWAVFVVEDNASLSKVIASIKKSDPDCEVRICGDRQELVYSDLQDGFFGYLYLYTPSGRYARFDNPFHGRVLVDDEDAKSPAFSKVSETEVFQTSYTQEELAATSLVDQSVCVIDGEFRRLKGIVVQENETPDGYECDIKISTMTMTKIITVAKSLVRHIDSLKPRTSGSFEYGLIDNLLTQVDADRRLTNSGPSDEERERIRLKFIALTESFLRRLPTEEYDFLVLFYLDSVPQRSIGNLFGITQRAVSYRVSRAVDRLRFLVDIAEVEESQMREDLNSLFEEEEATDIVIRVFRVTNLSEVQRETGQTFFYVRSRFCWVISQLENVDMEVLDSEDPALAERVESYLRVLRLVQSNFGILNSKNKVRRTFHSRNLG